LKINVRKLTDTTTSDKSHYRNEKRILEELPRLRNPGRFGSKGENDSLQCMQLLLNLSIASNAYLSRV